MANIITLDEYRDYDDLPSPAENDDQITAMIELATSNIEKETGRVFETGGFYGDTVIDQEEHGVTTGSDEYTVVSNYDLIGNFEATDQEAFEVDALVTEMHFCTERIPLGATVVAHIYELDTGTLANSELIASSAEVFITADIRQWNIVPITATLERGKQYGFALQMYSAGLIRLRSTAALDRNNGTIAGLTSFGAPDPLGVITTSLHTFCIHVAYKEKCTFTRMTEILNGMGTSRLWTKNAPITCVNKVEYWDGDSWEEYDIVTYPYTFKTDSNAIYFTEGHKFFKGFQNIRVTFEHGYTGTLPKDLKLACYLMTKFNVIEAERQGINRQQDGEQSFWYGHNIPALALKIITRYKTVW